MNLIKVVHLKIINKLIVLKGLQRSHSKMDNCSFSMEWIYIHAKCNNVMVLDTVEKLRRILTTNLQRLSLTEGLI